MDIRTARLVKHLNISTGIGLELGPLTSPILSPEDANIRYVDHFSLEDLKEKYQNEPVDLDKIVKPDFVLGNKTLLQTVGRRRFDYVIASHVIEHVPDTVRWLQDLAAVLKPGGVVSLAIPDKRFTFDITRKVSTPAQVIGSYYDKLTRFSSEMMYDFASQCAVDIDSGRAWTDPKSYETVGRRWSAKEVETMCKDNLDPKKYVDCHCYVYTPESFIEILKELIKHNLLNYEVAGFMPTQHGELEFYVSLRKIDAKAVTPKRQLRLLPTFIHEDQVEALTNEVARLEQEVVALTHSVSWKVTRPIRAARKLQRKATK